MLPQALEQAARAGLPYPAAQQARRKSPLSAAMQAEEIPRPLTRIGDNALTATALFLVVLR